MRRIVVTLAALAFSGCRINFDELSPGGDGGAGDAAPPGGTWTPRQVNSDLDGSVGLAPTAAGSLILVAIQTADQEHVTAVTDDGPSGSNSYVEITAAHASNAVLADQLQMFYAAGARPDVTLVTATTVAGTPQSMVVWEFLGIRSTDPLVGAAALDEQSDTLVGVGPTVTIAGTGELVVSAVLAEKLVLGIDASTPGFAIDSQENANGFAHATSRSLPAGAYGAAWRFELAGSFCASTVAFRPGT